jgi:energy-coupling factor transporter ATP-binding protein EcfA2
MKLVAFRIQNFRSIVDSGWRDLSPDSITGLIGQNESGKTSVLEALNSFYDEKLDPDFRRSDGTMPEISCSFEISEEEQGTFFNEPNLPVSDLKTKLKEAGNRINLRCTWTDINTYVIELEQPAIAELFIHKAPATPAPAAAVPPAPEAVPATVTPAPETPVKTEEPAIEPMTAKDFIIKLNGAMPEFVYFEDFTSLIPNEIDIVDITTEDSKVEGITAVLNFLAVIGIKPEELDGKEPRIIQSLIDRCNKSVTTDFRDFWSQNIGLSNKIEIQMELKNHSATDAAKSGLPYLAFWVKDGDERLYPKQRSKGVRWFLSFYLQLKASQAISDNGQVLLIDEPGASLHARAQEDVLKVFESIKNTLQIVYTTHSPYLIKPETLYRLLAVQRENENDENSATKILDINNVGQASTDTMFPVYAIIGADLSHQQVVKNKDNVLLEEPSAYRYLSAFKKLTGESHEMHFMPATGVTKLPTLVNLFNGWGLQFGVVVDDDSSGRGVYNDLKKNWYGDDADEAKKHIYKIAGCVGIEDVFSKTDFKKYVLGDTSASYTNGNSEYLKEQSASGGNGASKIVLAYNFYQKVNEGSIKLTDLTQTTQAKIVEIMTAIRALL